MDNDADDFPGLRNTFDLNSRIMLSAIISLSAVVLLVITLHVYFRCALRRQARSRRQRFLGRIRSLGLTTSDEQPNTGLDPMVINSLPMFLFKQITTEFGEIYNRGGDGDKSSIECSVCLSMLEGEEMARLLPNCKHVFHAECIDKWLASHSTCPLCRMEAEPPRLLQPEPREGPAMAIVGSSAAAPSADAHQALDVANSSGYSVEGRAADGGVQLSSTAKIINGGSTSRLSSFQRILTRERSISRVQSCEEEDEVGIQDLERQ